MDNFLLVHEGDGRDQLLDDAAGLLLCEAVSPLQSLQQLSALHQLHDDVHVEPVHNDIHKLDDVGVTLAELQDLQLMLGVVSTATDMATIN